MNDDPPFSLEEFPVHLGLGATATVQERFTGEGQWYQRYGERTKADGAEGRLVSMFTFDGPWAGWEVHPQGEEVVICTAGVMTLYQEVDGEVRTVTLRAGQAVVNPAGVWHTADIEGTATAVFVTAGSGTEQRARTS